jgi:hypothetical protein
MKIRLLIPTVLCPLCSINAVAQVAADDAEWLVDPSGCKFLNPSDDSAPLPIQWDGKCVDGFVSGPGELKIEGRLPMVYRGDFAAGRIVRGSFQLPMVSYEGEFLDNAPHGRGTMKLPDGLVASGSFEKGHATGQEFELKWPNGSHYQGGVGKHLAMEGTGTLTYSDGTTYEGEFRDGRLEGNGVLKYTAGEIRRGVFVDGKLQGKGSIHYSNGADYEGELRAGQPDGQGRLTYANGGFYEGAFVGGLSQGKGKLQYGTGDVYEGDFLAGEPHGTGVFRSVIGDIYEGHFVSGKRHGQGRLTFSIGDVWEGEWKQGKLYGKCRKSSAQSVYDGECADDHASGTGRFEDRVAGITYDGEFRYNTFEGEGYMRTPDLEYKGSFKQGLKDGAGKQTQADGTEYDGAFVRGFMQGRGVLRTKAPSGTETVYDGEFVQGQMEGTGTLRMGSVQVKGVFKDNVFNRGTITAEDGRKFEVDIDEGKVLEVLEGGLKRPLDQLPPDITI